MESKGSAELLKGFPGKGGREELCCIGAMHFEKYGMSNGNF